MADGDKIQVVTQRQQMPEATPGLQGVLPLDAFPVEYVRWNAALCEHFFARPRPAGEGAVHLSLTPAALLAIARIAGAQVGGAEDAEIAFSNAIRECYQRVVAQGRGGLRRLHARLPDGTFAAAGFLAGTVLAAGRMQSDDEAQGMAYYIRLAAVLGVECVRGVPRGFEQLAFAELWMALEAWVREQRGLQLAMPIGDKLRKYVAYPMVHVLLRKLDIERLPEFFLASGFPPGLAVAPSTLEHPFGRWAATHLTAAGRAALTDERRMGVLSQVAGELERWDGAVVDSQGGRSSATVDILLDLPQRSPVFEYIARRPAGFPEVFEAGDRVFQASDPGWYDPTPVPPGDGAALAEGFSWDAPNTNGHRCSLRRAAAQVIAFIAGEEYTGLISHGALKLNSCGAVLCAGGVLSEVAAYLTAVSGRHAAPLRSCATVPAGWHLFVGITPVRYDVAVPEGLEGLGIRTETDIRASGGLRLGRRSAWLTSAPPAVSVTGDLPGRVVSVDDHQVPVAEDGNVPVSDALSVAGVHTIVAGGSTRRLEMVEPLLAPGLHSPDELAGEAPQVFALPAGHWCVVGEVPGQMLELPPAQHGVFASAGWAPVVALPIGRAKPFVLFLGEIPPPPQRCARRSPVQEGEAAWAHAICSAAVRRPRVASLFRALSPADASRRWVEYVNAASDIKRRHRRGRR